jgi:hypothetical protein
MRMTFKPSLALLWLASAMNVASAGEETLLKCVSSEAKSINGGVFEYVTQSGYLHYVFQISQKAIEGRLKSKTPQALSQLTRSAANDAFFSLYKSRKGAPEAEYRLAVTGAQSRDLVCDGQRAFVYVVRESNLSWVIGGNGSPADHDPTNRLKPSLQDAFDL